jgi:hypothetical protein
MAQGHSKTAGLNTDSEQLIRITFFKGGIANIKPDKTLEVTWDEFSKLFIVPKYGEKDGSYIVRGECLEKRNNNYMNAVRILIIDADKHCIKAEDAIKVLEQTSFQFIFYTTFTHTPEEPRYRILIHLSREVNEPESKQIYKNLPKMKEINLYFTKLLSSCTKLFFRCNAEKGTRPIASVLCCSFFFNITAKKR